MKISFRAPVGGIPVYRLLESLKNVKHQLSVGVLYLDFDGFTRCRLCVFTPKAS